MEYYLHYECPKCGEDVYERCLNTIEHKGLPVFDLDDNSQTMMTCPKCDCSFGTGDIEVYETDEM